MFFNSYNSRSVLAKLAGLIAGFIITQNGEFHAQPPDESVSFSLAKREVRKFDSYGFGYYGASRGDRRHAGTDYVIKPGEPVYSPASGTILRLGKAYTGDDYELAVIKTQRGDTVKILYVKPIVEPGEDVMCGQLIGYAQDITARYPGITAHVHVEVVTATGGQIDPTTYTAGCSA